MSGPMALGCTWVSVAVDAQSKSKDYIEYHVMMVMTEHLCCYCDWDSVSL